MQDVKIHQTAIVGKQVVVRGNVKIGAYSIIEGNVEIGDNTMIDSHVVIQGKVRLGKNNFIGSFSSIGANPQHIRHRNEPTSVEIGDFNDIREHVTIHRGTLGNEEITRLGHNNLLMVATHVGHDCQIGSYNIFSNNTGMGGHVKVGSYVTTSYAACIHQFCRVGDYVMLGPLSALRKDIPPFMLLRDDYFINYTGLKRNGFSKDEIRQVKKIITAMKSKKVCWKESKQQLKSELPEGRIKSSFFNFVNAESKRRILL